MKRSMFVAPILAAALIAPMTPAVTASASSPVVQGISASNKKGTEQALKAVNQRIAQLQASPAATAPKVNLGNEFEKLLNTALELRETLEAIIAGRVPAFNLSTIKDRVDLFLVTSQTIIRATQELTTKVDSAHIELGFCITRAVIRLINPTATSEQLAASRADVLATFERVSTYPNLKPTDRATIYVKASLDSKIWQVRFARDKNLLGKNAKGYFATNRALTHAVGVWFNPTATVAQVVDEMNTLDATYAAAVKA